MALRRPAPYHPPMRRRRRATALLLALLLLQMLGLGSGVLRAAPAADCDTAMSQPAGEMAGMAGMDDMPGMPMPQSHDGSHGTPRPADDDSGPPCRLPWAPLGCASAACLPMFALADGDAPPAPSAVHEVVGAAVVSLPDSPTRTPELPPPRA
jgi:hypothetical protein